MLDFLNGVFPADPGQTVCVYTAEPGSASAQALALLASWSAPESTAAPAPAEADPGAAQQVRGCFPARLR
ncbi:hypothetical protein [Streptomyces afghaniensis]|uniref:hypothetical protein n=1 Tax=Streptomyces afghaniensis TaxID=66865 RepID=UPI0037AF71CA